MRDWVRRREMHKNGFFAYVCGSEERHRRSLSIDGGTESDYDLVANGTLRESEGAVKCVILAKTDVILRLNIANGAVSKKRHAIVLSYEQTTSKRCIEANDNMNS